MSESLRLNKYLALHLGISRREADLMIEKNEIAVNGSVASLGSRLSATDIVTVNSKPIDASTLFSYLMFHKPVGYVCSRRAQGDNPTIYDLISSNYHALKPVGRLDKDSSGLLLLSNDGDFTQRMTHPKYAKSKEYHITLDRDLEPLHHQMIADYGVELADGTSRFGLTRPIDSSRKEWIVLMSEGRNRQIRRTFAALGYTVATLHRTRFGQFELGDLPQGQSRSVDIQGA